MEVLLSARDSRNSEENVPTQQSSPETDSRLPRPHEIARRQTGDQETARQRKAASRGLVAPKGADSGFMSPRSAGLGRDRRIRKSSEFAATLKAGFRGTTEFLSVVMVPAPGGGRLGISVPVRVGGSVERNRSRRRVREYYRKTYERGAAPYDMVFNLKPGFAQLSAADAGRALDEALSKAIAAGKRPGRRAHPVH